MDGKQNVIGVSLIEVLRHKSTLDEPALKGILLPIADALEKAHDQNRLHLAISPATIMLQGGATPVLIGFEAGAKAPQDPGYSAIERYSNEYRTGRWTDIYSLGAVAYRLISGHPPPAAQARIEGEPMRSAREIGERTYHKSLLEAIDWALKVHPLERPQNLAQWKDALIGLRDHTSTGGAANATVPITATMVLKFSEARRGKPSPDVTPIPPPLVEKPKPPPAPEPEPEPEEEPESPPPPPRKVEPAPARMAPPPPQDEPFPEMPPMRPSLWSAILAVVVLGSAIGYAWFAQRSKAPLPVPAAVVEQPKPAAAAPVPAPPPVAQQAAPALVQAQPAPAQTPAVAVPAETRPDTNPQARITRELAAKLQGDWSGRAAYSSVLRGLDCTASVTRNWMTSIRGASADGKTIAGTFSTVLQADGGKDCPKAHYDVQVDGDFTARVQSPTALQVSARVRGCSGNCDDNRGLLLYKTLNRTYRVAVSAKADQLRFTDNATDFNLRKR